MEICGNNLPLSLSATARAIGGSQGGAALFRIPWDVSILTCTADTDSEDTGGITITVAIILKLATIATGPYIDTAKTIPSCNKKTYM